MTTATNREVDDNLVRRLSAPRTELTPADEAAAREAHAAMLSVYHHSTSAPGRRTGGLPPPQPPPIRLHQAVAILQRRPRGLDQARSVLLRHAVFDRPDLADAVRPILSRDQAEAFNRHRAETEALVWDAVAGDLPPHARLDPSRLRSVARGAADRGGPRLPHPDALARALALHHHGAPDAVPATEAWDILRSQMAARSAGYALTAGSAAAQSAAVRWDTGHPQCHSTFDWNSMSTTVTISTTITGPDREADLAYAMDPRHWSKTSTLFRESFVTNDTSDDPAPCNDLAPGASQWERRFFERVEMGLSATSDGVASFRNLLNMTFDHQPTAHIESRFSLFRSISSAIFLDDQPGGILRDNGFVRVLSLPPADGRAQFAFEARKELKFADRTPGDSRGIGPLDWGNMLNYWSPAILCMWLESDLKELEYVLNGG